MFFSGETLLGKEWKQISENDQKKELRQARAALACCFLLGAGLLAGWNALITAADYFSVVLPGSSVELLLTVCYLPVCLLTLLACMSLHADVSPSFPLATDAPGPHDPSKSCHVTSVTSFSCAVPGHLAIPSAVSSPCSSIVPLGCPSPNEPNDFSPPPSPYMTSSSLPFFPEDQVTWGREGMTHSSPKGMMTNSFSRRSSHDQHYSLDGSTPTSPAAPKGGSASGGSTSHKCGSSHGKGWFWIQRNLLNACSEERCTPRSSPLHSFPCPCGSRFCFWRGFISKIRTARTANVSRYQSTFWTHNLWMWARDAIVSTHGRVVIGFAGFTIAMGIVPSLDILSQKSPSSGSNWLLPAILVVAGAVGVFDGFSQGAVFAEVATLPPAFTHAVVSGTASSGVVICVLRIVTKLAATERHGSDSLGSSFGSPPSHSPELHASASSASYSSDPDPETKMLRASTQMYFALAGLICFSCLLVRILILPRLSVWSRHHHPHDRQRLRHCQRLCQDQQPVQDQQPIQDQQPVHHQIQNNCARSSRRESSLPGVKDAGITNQYCNAGDIDPNPTIAAKTAIKAVSARSMASSLRTPSALHTPSPLKEPLWEGHRNEEHIDDNSNIRNIYLDYSSGENNDANNDNRSKTIDNNCDNDIIICNTVHNAVDEHCPTDSMDVSQLSNSRHSLDLYGNAPLSNTAMASVLPTTTLRMYGWISRFGKAASQPFESIVQFCLPRGSVRCLRRVVRPCWALFVIYGTTLTVFPGVLVERIQSPYLGSWSATVVITLYNVGDLLGKSVTLPRSKSVTPALPTGTRDEKGICRTSSKEDKGSMSLSLTTLTSYGSKLASVLQVEQLRVLRFAGWRLLVFFALYGALLVLAVRNAVPHPSTNGIGSLTVAATSPSTHTDSSSTATHNITTPTLFISEPITSSDVVWFLAAALTFLFGISNGYLTAWSLTMVSEHASLWSHYDVRALSLGFRIQESAAPQKRDSGDRKDKLRENEEIEIREDKGVASQEKQIVMIQKEGKDDEYEDEAIEGDAEVLEGLSEQIAVVFMMTGLNVGALLGTIAATLAK
eukprot:CAMPEP_0175056326 /NCGR_PEP_ID=MMETSP0052_2-20121109/10604_1 /TAXON_ID=51329 ORGANISM="Polytomella parva, Strain SAG 63-3" /NCGR_SAMPLE_ID=MMETSP0052_2 /ASSEMBLY_ACC=CAM_ASM_000194 /LENGTH=1064 /DNA_ID=CAMNT_0016321331 /DNA_START=42 /DNA_END=3236 /DNA_ORIENTATION=-